MTIMGDAKTQYILLVEDNLVDARLMQILLSKPDVGEFSLHRVGTLQAALAVLAQRPFAAILLDLVLPDGDGLEIVQRVHRASPQTPIVVLTNLVNEALATQAMQAGAQDYLLKSEVNSRSLARALRYAIERQALLLELHKQTEALQASETRLRTLIDATPDTVCFKDGAGRWLGLMRPT
jgi:CheY-like chemotaxis protein